MLLTATEIDKIAKLGIDTLVLFGSQAQNNANINSDYDFFVIGKKSNEIYDSLFEILSNRINKITDIDIVFDEESPMELKNHVIKYGEVLYQKSDNIFANFKAQTMTIYQDFAPYRQEFQNAILNRIN